jgi:hypothetical protein
MLESIGEAMTPEELYGVMLQLKHLGEDPDYKLDDLRFFGKFFGLFRNYYVFEGTPKQRPAAVNESEPGTFDYVNLCMQCMWGSGIGQNQKNQHTCMFDLALGSQRPAYVKVHRRGRMLELLNTSQWHPHSQILGSDMQEAIVHLLPLSITEVKQNFIALTLSRFVIGLRHAPWIAALALIISL